MSSNGFTYETEIFMHFYILTCIADCVSSSSSVAVHMEWIAITHKLVYEINEARRANVSCYRPEIQHKLTGNESLWMDKLFFAFIIFWKINSVKIECDLFTFE